MMKPLKIPRGVAYLFCQDLVTGDEATEDTQYRPDFLNNDMRNEIINNWLSHISPISLVKKTPYLISDVMFMSYFGRI
jgi:hypothetical protein